MSEFKGTKERWLINHTVIYADDYFQTHIMYAPSTYTDEISKANVLLASKAPEMLDMIKKMMAYMPKNNINDANIYFEAMQLIKEATELQHIKLSHELIILTMTTQLYQK